MYSGDIWTQFWMFCFSFINVVCEILKLNCDFYKYMLYLSHGKAKEKKEKKEKKEGAFPECLGTWHSGKGKFKKKEGAFPECLGTWHSGKSKLKKRQGPSPSAWAPGTWGRGSKKKFIPQVLRSGKSKKPVDNVNEGSDGD
jgi:hypothetical protein